MNTSRAFIDFISRSTLKGVERYNGRFRIKRKILSTKLLSNLAETAISSFGYVKRKDAERDIYQAFELLANEFDEQQIHTSIDFRNISSGSILTIEYDGNNTIELLCTNRKGLIVLKNSDHTVVAGDVLYSLKVVIRTGDEGVFQVTRQGHSYPSEDKCLVLPDIRTVTIHRNDGVNILSETFNQNAICKMGSSFAYVLKASGNGCFINPADMTLKATDGLIHVVFNADSSIIFKLNENINKNFSEFEQNDFIETHHNILQRIKAVSDMDLPTDNVPLDSLKTIEHGVLEPQKMSDGAIWLRVIKKMKVGI